MIKAVSFQVNYIRSELQADRSLRLPTRVVLGRLGGYTNRGEKECWPTNQQLAEECGLSIHAVANAIAELQERKLITVRSTRFNNRKVRYIRLLPYSNSSRGELSQYESSCDESSSDEDQKFTSCTFNSSRGELSSSLLDVEKNRKRVVEIAREKNDNSNSAPALNDVPLPDDSDFYETEENAESEPDLNDLYGTECTYNAQEHANPPQTSNYTSNTSNTLSAQFSNEIEGVKRQLTIPSSVEEVIPLIEKFKNAHKAEKVFEEMDVSFYAGKIFDYYAGSDGIWRDSKGNEIPPYRIFQKISTWIVNDQRAGKLQTTAMNFGAISQDFLKNAFAEIDQKKQAEREAKMRQFGIKPPPVNATFEVLEGDEQNEQKLLEAK